MGKKEEADIAIKQKEGIGGSLCLELDSLNT